MRARSLSHILTIIFLVMFTIILSMVVASYIYGWYMRESRFEPALSIRMDSYVVRQSSGLEFHIHVINEGFTKARIVYVKVYDYSVSARSVNYTVMVGRAWREGEYIVITPGTELWLYGLIKGANLPENVASVRVEIVCLTCRSIGNARVVK